MEKTKVEKNIAEIVKKNTWMQIHSALTRGDRGLPKTGGLTKLLGILVIGLCGINSNQTRTR